MVPRGTAWRRAKEVSPSPSGLIHVKMPLAVTTGTPKGGGGIWEVRAKEERTPGRSRRPPRRDSACLREETNPLRPRPAG